MVEGASNSIHYHTGNGGAVKRHRPRVFDRLKRILLNSGFIIGAAAFFIGRVSILNTLSPFGIAFTAAASLTGGIKDTAIVGTGIVIGLLTMPWSTGTMQTIITLMLLFASAAAFKINEKSSVIKTAIIAFTINMTVSVLSILLVHGSLIIDETLIGLFNSAMIMALIYIYNYCLPVVEGKRRRSLLSSEETICLLILLSVVISGFSGISIYGISLKGVLSVFVIIMVSFLQGPGFGAAAGTTIGLITCISSDQMPYIIGAYAFSGLLCGIFKGMGKLGGCIGFVMADFLINFYMGAQIKIVGTGDLIAGILLFLVVPSSFTRDALMHLDRNFRDSVSRKPYMERTRNMIRSRINRITDAFQELSRTLSEDESSAKLRHSTELNSVISSVVDRVCASCDVRDTCWKKDFYRTYQNMFAMFDVIEADGELGMDTLPDDLKRICVRANQMVKTANYMFEMYRMNYKWSRKAQEGKYILKEQLDGISAILDDLSGEVDSEVVFKGDIEDEVAIALDREGVEFDDIAVIRDKSGRMEVNVYRKACLGKRECVKDIAPAVSRALKRKMRRDNSSCSIQGNGSICCFKLIESVNYQVSTGIARDVKDPGGLSGDNYSFIELDNGRYMMALSDGMGTGPSAAVESNSAITLLEKYLEAGFDEATAIRAINSAISLRSPDDNFTTIDLCLMDLYTGEAEIIKIGAASTYIKRSEGCCESIVSTTLPAGILESVDVEKKEVKLSHGDMIIMVTDGVQEAGDNTAGDWVMSYLEGMDSKNPQEIAENIIRKALGRNNGRKLDDMTVLVSKVWQVI